MPSEESQEKELSLQEFFAGCPDEIKETALISDENQEQSQETVLSANPQDKQKASIRDIFCQS